MLDLTRPDAYDPWVHAAELDLLIVHELLPRPYRGYWDAATKTITLHKRLSQTERRCTLTHELIHYERGDDGQCASDWHRNRLEQLVHLEAARRLIWLDDLATATILHPGDEHAQAEELWVDRRTLRARLAGLGDVEARRLEEMSRVVYRRRTA